MKRLAIMQGRLLPPIANHIQAFPALRWQEEFALAERAGLDAIEWIYDVGSEGANPLDTDEGIEQMRTLARQHAVGVFSVCADYYMQRPLLRGTRADRQTRVEHLIWLMDRCRRAGIERIVLPFVDQSNVATSTEQHALIALLAAVLPQAKTAKVELHLEMSLPPLEFASFLDQVTDERVKVNYDSGNSASLGYRCAEELRAYGRRIGSVHIKDRVRSGGTVPLGCGGADFEALFGGLAAAGYDGDLVLQVARGASGEELASARRNIAFVKRFVAAWT